MVQESLSNVLRHARASRVQVTVSSQHPGLLVLIDDDGIGVGSVPGDGAGLRSMVNRVRALGGELVVSSKADGGTRVHVEIPVGVTA